MSTRQPDPAQADSLDASALVARGLRYAILGGLVTVLAAAALMHTDLQGAADVYARARPGWIVGALALTTLGLVFLAARWRALMPCDTPVALLPLTAILVSGTLMHYAVPGPVGELVAAGMAAKRWNVSIEQAFAAGVHARFVGLALAGLVAVLLFLTTDMPIPEAYRDVLGIASGVIAVGAVGLFALSAQPALLRRTGGWVLSWPVWPQRVASPLRHRLGNLADALAAVGRLGPRRYFEAALWALGGHACVAGGIGLAAIGLGANPSPAGLVFTYAMTTAGAVALFGIPGAQVGWDAMFSALLVATTGMSLQSALGVLVVVRTQQVFVVLVGAITLVVSQRAPARPPAAPDAANPGPESDRTADPGPS
ncbi:MAG: flippase-like domain-containing protein [Myxococcales bacterium]|nr:flippase-like domain-containing protein [Myxococcales bacterium]